MMILKPQAKKANFFEVEMAKQKGDPLEDEKRRIEKEKRAADLKEKERKQKIQDCLAKLKQGINK